MNIDKDKALDELEADIRAICALREAGFGEQIDAAYERLERGEITEEQYYEILYALR